MIEIRVSYNFPSWLRGFESRLPLHFFNNLAANEPDLRQVNGVRGLYHVDISSRNASAVGWRSLWNPIPNGGYWLPIRSISPWGASRSCDASGKARNRLIRLSKIENVSRKARSICC